MEGNYLTICHFTQKEEIFRGHIFSEFQRRYGKVKQGEKRKYNIGTPDKIFVKSYIMPNQTSFFGQSVVEQQQLILSNSSSDRNSYKRLRKQSTRTHTIRHSSSTQLEHPCTREKGVLKPRWWISWGLCIYVIV